MRVQPRLQSRQSCRFPAGQRTISHPRGWGARRQGTLLTRTDHTGQLSPPSVSSNRQHRQALGYWPDLPWCHHAVQEWHAGPDSERQPRHCSLRGCAIGLKNVCFVLFFIFSFSLIWSVWMWILFESRCVYESTYSSDASTPRGATCGRGSGPQYSSTTVTCISE